MAAPAAAPAPVAGAALTSVWFSESNASTAPAFNIQVRGRGEGRRSACGLPLSSLPQLNTTAALNGSQAAAMGASPAGAGFASWGLRDFTLYVTAFHNTVVYTSNATDGFVSACRARSPCRPCPSSASCPPSSPCVQ